MTRQANQLTDLLVILGLSQHVEHSTHDLGGIIDVVVTRSDLPAHTVSVINVGLFDHRYVKFGLDLNRLPPVYNTLTKRTRGGFDVEQFRAALSDSPLCNATYITAQSDTETMTNTYNSVITNILGSPC